MVQWDPAMSQGGGDCSEKPVLVGAGLRRKAVCSHLIRLPTREGFEKCTNTGLQQL